MEETKLSRFINLKAPILITGASGTGKSALAKKIFEHSKIYKEKFLTLHLASIKEELIESELFGHRRGAFTGAIENRLGYLGQVGKGTLFIDEIGELSLDAQKKLLYLLEEKKYTPVGGTQSIQFEGRIILATNRNLKKMVDLGEFREDLYYRLCTFQHDLKSLTDIPRSLLEVELMRLWALSKETNQRKDLVMEEELKRVLLAAPWRGNWRELKHCLEYLVVMASGKSVGTSSLPDWFEGEARVREPLGSYQEALEHFEAAYFKIMLDRFKGRVNATAKALGISKTTLIYKTKKYQINTLSIRAHYSNEKSMNCVA